MGVESGIMILWLPCGHQMLLILGRAYRMAQHCLLRFGGFPCNLDRLNSPRTAVPHMALDAPCAVSWVCHIAGKPALEQPVETRA